MSNKQGNLFGAAPAVEKRVRFRANCSKCGRQIVNVEHYQNGALIFGESEYQDEQGRCYNCAKKARFKK